MITVGAISTMAAALIAALGGWDNALKALIVFMVLDYLTGLLVAVVFKSSPKTESGALCSLVFARGVAKKIMLLIYVAAGLQLDYVLGTSFLRDAVIIAFIASELISITENAGLMGVPMPSPLRKAIDVLQKKGS